MPSISKNKSAGDIARETLIQAGLDMFGQYGFNSVSVRQICDHADMNIASINYHFGGKEGLYIAVADHIAGELRAHTEVAIKSSSEFLNSGSTDADTALEHLLHILDKTVDILVPDSVETQRWARFITRFQLGEGVPEHDLCKNPMNELSASLIGIIRGKPEAKLENAIYALTLFGQILVFRVSRVTSTAALGVSSFGPKETAQIKQVVFANVRKSLSSENDK